MATADRRVIRPRCRVCGIPSWSRTCRTCAAWIAAIAHIDAARRAIREARR